MIYYFMVLIKSKHQTKPNATGSYLVTNKVRSKRAFFSIWFTKSILLKGNVS